jgi:hypothetical protein
MFHHVFSISCSDNYDKCTDLVHQEITIFTFSALIAREIYFFLQKQKKGNYSPHDAIYRAHRTSIGKRSRYFVAINPPTTFVIDNLPSLNILALASSLIAAIISSNSFFD